MMGMQEMTFRDSPHQGNFNFFRCGGMYQAAAVGDAENMGVNGDPRLPEGDVENDIRGFAADTGKRRQGIKRSRDLTAEIVQKFAAKPDDRFRLVVVKADGLDLFRHAVFAKFQVVFRGPADFPERVCYLVDLAVCGLGGQHDGDQQVKGR